MSIRCTKWAQDQRLDNPSAQIVLYVIADFADEDGMSWPRLATIATLSRQSRSSVKRRLREMQALGLLTRNKRHLDSGRRTTDELRLQLDKFVSLSSAAENDLSEDASDTNQDVVGEGGTGQIDPTAGVRVTADPTVGSQVTRGTGHSWPDSNPLSKPPSEPRSRQRSQGGQIEPPQTQPLQFVWKGSRAWHAWLAHHGKSTWPETTHRVSGEMRRGWWFPSLFPPKGSGGEETLSEKDANDFH